MPMETDALPLQITSKDKLPVTALQLPPFPSKCLNFAGKSLLFLREQNTFSHSHPSISRAHTPDFHHLAFTKSHSIPWLLGKTLDVSACGVVVYWLPRQCGGDDVHDNCSKAVGKAFLEQERAGLSACLPKSQNSALSSHWTVFSNTFKYSQRQVKLPERSQLLCYSHENWIIWKIICF